jgi:hypothetical protein
MKINLWIGFLIVLVLFSIFWMFGIYSSSSYEEKIATIIIYIFIMGLVIPILYFKVPIYFGISDKNIYFKYNKRVEEIPWNEIESIRLGEEGLDKPTTIIQFRNGKHHYIELSDGMINELKRKAKCRLS